MYLYIDNSKEGEILCAAIEEGGLVKKREFKNSPNNKPLLFFIQEFLKKEKKKITDIEGLAILTGQGRFTATRILSTVANGLAFGLNIPVIAVKDFSESEIVKKLKKARFGIYVSATYSAAPHIDGVQKM